jgi:hypothetical protein
MTEKVLIENFIYIQKSQRRLDDLNGNDNANDVLAFAILELVLYVDINAWVNLQNRKWGIVAVDFIFDQGTLDTGVDARVGIREFEWDVNA